MIWIYMFYIFPLLLLTAVLLHRNHWKQPWTGDDASFDSEFLKQVVTDGFWGGNEEIRRILSQLLSSYRKKPTKGNTNFVVITWASKNYQMLELDPSDSAVKFKGKPMIPLRRWGFCGSEDTALRFLHAKKENVEMIVCSTEDVFRALFEHLAPTCRFSGEMDKATNLRIYQGHLSPAKV